MNLVFVNTVPIWGGGEVWTLAAMRALRDRGHDLRLVAAGDGELLDRTRGEAWSTIGFPRGGWGRWRAARRLRESLAEWSAGPVVFVALTGADARLASALRPRGSRDRIVLSRHLSRELDLRWLRRITLRHLDLVIANSDATRAAMRRSLPWLGEERIVTVHNPFDAEAFRSYAPRPVREENRIPPTAPVIGIVARLDRGKGHEVLLRALPAVLAREPETVLLVAGDGPRGEALRQAARDLGIADSCRFLGHVEPVQPCYEASDVVAVPSFHEGFCYAAVEAQALGRPLVASRVGSLPEVVAEGESGLLVAPRDPAALASALLSLLADRDRAERMGEAGRRFVERFAPGPIFDRLEGALLPPAGEGSHS